MSKARAQEEIGPVEFVQWQQFLLQEREESFEQFDRLDWQLAGLAWHVHDLKLIVNYLFSKDRPRNHEQVKDFLIKVKFEKPKPEVDEDGELLVKPGIPVFDGDTSQFWLAAVGWVPSQESK